VKGGRGLRRGTRYARSGSTCAHWSCRFTPGVGGNPSYFWLLPTRCWRRRREASSLFRSMSQIGLNFLNHFEVGYRAPSIVQSTTVAPHRNCIRWLIDRGAMNVLLSTLNAAWCRNGVDSNADRAAPPFRRLRVVSIALSREVEGRPRNDCEKLDQVRHRKRTRQGLSGNWHPDVMGC
jgi:hypothetical protein